MTPDQADSLIDCAHGFLILFGTFLLIFTVLVGALVGKILAGSK